MSYLPLNTVINYKFAYKRNINRRTELNTMQYCVILDYLVAVPSNNYRQPRRIRVRIFESQTGMAPDVRLGNNGASSHY